MVTSPIQTSFAGGELSPRLRGRVDLEVYRRGLSECRNWMILPQGPLLMRPGTEFDVDLGALNYAPRLIPIYIDAEPRVAVLLDGALRVYGPDGLMTFQRNRITNGHFDATLDGWDKDVNVVWAAPGVARLPPLAGGDEFILMPDAAALPSVLGNVWRIQFRARVSRTLSAGDTCELIRKQVGGVQSLTAFAPTDEWQNFSFDYVETLASVNRVWGIRAFRSAGNAAYDLDIDDFTIYRVTPADTVTDFTTPWSKTQFDAIRFDDELVNNRTVLVHPDAEPYTFISHFPEVLDVYAVGFQNRPDVWRNGNWPSLIAVGFQGRTIFGGTPEQPSTIWGTESGTLATFTVTPQNADDSYEWVVSTKGGLRWLQGKQVLLAGSQTIEHSIRGSDRIITFNDVDISDESAFGSAAIAAVHIGDQVLFVTRDRRHIRALDYSRERDSWISQALTFAAEHLTAGKLKELHFSHSPDPVIVALRTDGDVIACTYDRSVEAIAWWRIEVGAPVASIAVSPAESGSELWLLVTRTIGGVARRYIERLPLHENGAVYVDSAKSGVIAADGTFGGLAHLEGETVRVLVNGALEDDQVVAGGVVQAVTAQRIADDPTLVGATVVVGLPYTARATTLPFEGGSPRGTAQGAKRRFVNVGVILNDSGLPLVQGKRVPDRTPATAQDQAEPRRTGAFAAAGALGWESEGVITIEQDLPVRTEVLALFGIASVHER